ncbi:hypothetical protein CDV31_006183 [Fusarium ambrosium]|uniref:Uncharacterized protein n=1 Tax=Fusarium ambrosium TaxID=131363 RepID=A0A428UEH8_9HYPO|nr:hypothetical protein CDV31_006183 [Fusarium ambrosium]
MLGPSIRAFTMMLFLVSTNMLYLVFRIGGEASLFIYAANMFWMLVVTCSIGLLGWLRATSRTYDMSTHLLATIVMGGSWCILGLNSAGMYTAAHTYRRH